MPRLLSEILDEARGLLIDRGDTKRYSDADLLTYVNVAIQEIRRERPDMFFGSYADAVPQFTIAQLASEFPFDQFASPTAEFVAGSAELRDDEFVVDGKASTLRISFWRRIGATGKYV